jgi:hypothetical protein
MEIEDINRLREYTRKLKKDKVWGKEVFLKYNVDKMYKGKKGLSFRNKWSDKETAKLFGESQGEGISIPLQIAIEYLESPTLFINCQNMSQAKKLLEKIKSGARDLDEYDLKTEKDIQEYIYS